MNNKGVKGVLHFKSVGHLLIILIILLFPYGEHPQALIAANLFPVKKQIIQQLQISKGIHFASFEKIQTKVLNYLNIALPFLSVILLKVALHYSLSNCHTNVKEMKE